jgi:hypothetical protein
MFETLRVPFAEAVFEDLWSLPEGVEAAVLCRATDGHVPRLATRCAAYRDGERLYVHFRGEDDSVRASHVDRDAPLYEEDAVEIFLAPESLTTYFEIEVNPLGTLFDARVDSPDGDRATMRVDRGWNCEGLWAASRRLWTDGSRSEFVTLVSIPLGCISADPPKSGDRWRANFCRIDRSAAGDEFSAWQPTLRTPPDFHVPAAFGGLEFV